MGCGLRGLTVMARLEAAFSQVFHRLNGVEEIPDCLLAFSPQVGNSFVFGLLSSNASGEVLRAERCPCPNNDSH